MNIIIANKSQLLSKGIRMVITSIFNDAVFVESNSTKHLVDKLSQMHSCTCQVLLINQDFFESLSLKKLREISPEIKICLIPFACEHYPCGSEWIKSFDGVLSQHPTARELKQAISTLLLNQSYFPDETRSIDIVRPVVSQKAITPRQQEVLTLMAQGLRNKDIAHQLNLTEGTIKRHLSDTFKALGVHNRVDAARVSANLGLLIDIESCIS